VPVTWEAQKRMVYAVLIQETPNMHKYLIKKYYFYSPTLKSRVLAECYALLATSIRQTS
jgi:hypothetical protein